MSTNIVSKFLIILGSVTLLYALNMSIAFEGSTVANLQMMNDRQNTLLIGGIFFISGIILFSLTKLKQTDEETALEKAKIDSRAKNTKAAINFSFDKFSQSANLIFVTFQRLRHFYVENNEGVGSIFIRLILSFIYGSITALLALLCEQIENYLIYGNLYVFLMVIYSLKGKPLLDVLNHIIFISLILNTFMLTVDFLERFVINPHSFIPVLIFSHGIPAAGLIIVHFIKKNKASVLDNTCIPKTALDNPK